MGMCKIAILHLSVENNISISLSQLSFNKKSQLWWSKDIFVDFCYFSYKPCGIQEVDRSYDFRLTGLPIYPKV